jgi:hypothetical protein
MYLIHNMSQIHQTYFKYTHSQNVFDLYLDQNVFDLYLDQFPLLILHGLFVFSLVKQLF